MPDSMGCIAIAAANAVAAAADAYICEVRLKKGGGVVRETGEWGGAGDRGVGWCGRRGSGVVRGDGCSGV